jgi:hypothetical protein
MNVIVFPDRVYFSFGFVLLTVGKRTFGVTVPIEVRTFVLDPFFRQVSSGRPGHWILYTFLKFAG